MDKMPADAIIQVTDGFVLTKTVKTRYDCTGKELSSELVAFEVMPQIGRTEIKSVAISYNKAIK